MNIWSAEIKDLEKLHDSFKGQHSRLDKELEKLVKTDDENMVLVYARRCLEVIITDLCERELKRDRGTEPLKGIIDKLNKEQKVPHNIIVSMQNLNSLSSFGAHPKDFDPRQVKPVLLDLTTVLEWYLDYMETQPTDEAEPDAPGQKRKEPTGVKKAPAKPKRHILLASAVVLVCAVIFVVLILTDVISGGKGVKAGAIESVLILPFGNYTGNDQLEPLVSGMHSSLIREMGRLSGLRVICKTSSDVFKDADMTVHEIASEMGVDAVIEASVLCLGDTICMAFSMISGDPEEKQLWIGDFKEEKSKIFNLYNRVTKQISDEVKIELTPDEKLLLAKTRTVDPEALVAYMKGQFHWERLGDEDLDSALHYFQIAIEKDPDWAEPYAGMAMTWNAIGGFSVGPLTEAYKKTSEYLNKALDLDPNSANSHYIKAVLSVWPGWDWETGEKEFLKSLELNPNDALARVYYAHLLMILRRKDEAIYQANLALALDPLRPLALGLYGVVMNYAGDHQAAMTQAKKALSIDPDNNFVYGPLANAYLATGDTLKWHKTMKRRWFWADDEYLASLDRIFQEGGYIAVIEDRIRVNEERYSQGGSIPLRGQAERYLAVKNYDKAMDYYEKAYAEKHWTLAYVSLDVIAYPELKDNPRYIALLKKMNLPMDEN